MKKIGLTGNQLKLIALITMTVDHVGMLLFPQHLFLRLIGRLAFPIFAYMIGEGCRHTRSMPRYFGLMAGMAVMYQLVYCFALHSLYQGILVTFSLSIAMVALVRLALEKKKAILWVAVAVAVVAVFGLTEVLPRVWRGSDFDVDYGFFGAMLPVGVYLGKNKLQKLSAAAVFLFILGRSLPQVQMYALLAIPLLALYNGQRGKWKMKYLFYIYYPAHMVLLHLLASIIAR